MSNATTELATQDIMDRPITFRPFMGSEDIILTANNVLKLIAKPTKSGQMPTPAQAIRFAKLCEARGLNPWEGDAFLVGYDTQGGPEFNLITAHQAFLKRAEVHPEFDGMESGVVVADAEGKLLDQPGDFVSNEQKLAGGWARVHFKTRKIPTYRRINLSTFSTGRSRWEKDPGGMIVKCAEADALRSSFPTKLGGLYLSEEFDAMQVAPKEKVAMPRALPNTPASAPQPQAEANHSASTPTGADAAAAEADQAKDAPTGEESQERPLTPFDKLLASLEELADSRGERDVERIRKTALKCLPSAKAKKPELASESECANILQTATEASGFWAFLGGAAAVK